MVSAELGTNPLLEGRFAIDIFDADEKHPVWHDDATANISAVTDRNECRALLREAVAKILDKFPPKMS